MFKTEQLWVSALTVTRPTVGLEWSATYWDRIPSFIPCKAFPSQFDRSGF